MTMLRENYAEFQESRMLPRGREVEIGVRISLSTPVPVHAAASVFTHVGQWNQLSPWKLLGRVWETYY